MLRALFDRAVEAADPRRTMPPLLPPPPRGRTVVVGAGKSAALMAQVVERHFGAPVTGLVVTRYGHAVPTSSVEVVEASHPVPDAAGEAAARRMLELVGGLGADDLVLALISGGGSALLALPAAGLTLADKQAVNRALLASGATIGEMNAVRKHLSAIKGGRLAAAAFPARVVTLAISDVPGDSLSVIASGPTVADATSFADAQAIIRRRGIAVPASVTRHLERAEDETPKPGDKRLARAEAHIVARPQASLEAAAEVARAAGIAPLLLGDAIEGEAREVATVMAGIALSAATHGHPLAAPAVLLSGGETTVTVSGPAGRGGRNTEFLLGLAVALQGAETIWAIAGDTDGIDGTEDAAGAIVPPDTLARAEAHDPRGRLAGHDSYSLFAALGDLVVTGPTLTNVNDFRAILVA
ncbi:MAG: glycerate kinase [Acetobacteraceae bacterium]|nr:glycerate kinase [Acetobacteraceae bacterium]